MGVSRRVFLDEEEGNWERTSLPYYRGFQRWKSEGSRFVLVYWFQFESWELRGGPTKWLLGGFHYRYHSMRREPTRLMIWSIPPDSRYRPVGWKAFEFSI